MVVFRLNNTSVSNPINWQDFGIRIFREDDINGLFIEFTTDLEFNGDGYRLIRDVFNNSLGCDLIDVEVIYYCDGVPRKLLDGYIIISECIFDLQRCIVKTKVFDNNYSSRINNNKSIQIDAYITETKNGEILAPINEITTQMFDTKTGILATDRRIPSVYVFDYLKHMISFMSDNTVTLVSSVFDVGGEYHGLTVTNGLSIRNNQKNATSTSFQKLFEALHKKINLSLYAKGNVLYIEKRDDVYLSGQSIQIDNIRDLTQFIDKEKLSSAVNVGSEPVLQEWECNNGEGCTNPQIRGFGFQEDQFSFKGVCNIDSVRNLKTTDIIFDTNVIEDILQYGNQTYDKNVIIIDTVATLQPTNRAAIATNPFNVGTFFFYNSRLRNNFVIQNYQNDLPNDILDYYTNPTPVNELDAQFSSFRDLTQRDIVISVTNFETRYSDVYPRYLPFNDLQFGTQYDPDQNVNRFTALFPGIYTFQYRYFITFQFSGSGADLDVRTVAVRRSGENNIIKEQTVQLVSFIFPNFGPPATFGNTFSIFMNTGDTLQLDSRILKPQSTPATVTAEFRNNSSEWVEPALFRCTQAQAFIFSNPTINPENFNRIKYEFERPLDYSDVVSLMDNPEKIVRITHPKLSGGRNCFIDEVVIQNLGKFETKFNLISNK